MCVCVKWENERGMKGSGREEEYHLVHRRRLRCLVRLAKRPMLSSVLNISRVWGVEARGLKYN